MARFRSIGCRPSHFIAGIRDWLRSATTGWGSGQHFDALEREAIAHELNLSRAEFETLMFAPSVITSSLSTRLARAGMSEIDLAASHGDVLRDMQRVCTHCSFRKRCMKDLKRGRNKAVSEYCLNEQTMQALASRAARSGVVRRGVSSAQPSSEIVAP